MMHMTFYWGKTVTILFDSWKTQTWNSYILSLLACFLISVFYQFAEDRRLKLKLLSSIPNSSSSAEAPLIGGARWKARTKWSPLRFLGAVFFCANSAIGYLLMLAIMSFNAGVFLAVVLGLGVGYLLFRDDGDVVVVDNPCACA